MKKEFITTLLTLPGNTVLSKNEKQSKKDYKFLACLNCWLLEFMTWKLRNSMLKILKIVQFRNKAFYGTTLMGLMKIKTKFSSMIG